MRRLPPLNALRAFEAAARHESFTRAGDELHVTQAAISQQVRQLEEWLGMQLFDRKGRTLALNAQGKTYLAELSAGFDALACATARLKESAIAGPLHVTVLPSFASKWLVPRLARFREAYPDIELQLATSADLHEFTDGEFDLGIRSGHGRWPGLESHLIAREYLSPLCSPALLSAMPLDSVADLRADMLLHDQPRDSWDRWLRFAGASVMDTRKGPRFSDSSLVLQAAVDGHGVALGRLFLAADDIAAGRLVKPFTHDMPNDYAYWLVCRPHAANMPRIAAFRSWVLEEASANCSAGDRSGETLATT